jgi:hypothetical protein
MATYNIDQLVSIRIYPAFEESVYKIVPDSGILGLGPRRFVVRGMLGHRTPLESFMESNSDQYFVKSGILYEKPCCVLSFSNRESKTIRFDTYEEAHKFGEEIKLKLKDKALEI